MLKAGPVTELVITANGKNVYFDTADVLEATMNGQLQAFKIVPDDDEIARRERNLLSIAERPWVLDGEFELVQFGIRYRGSAHCSYTEIDNLVASVDPDLVAAVPS